MSGRKMKWFLITIASMVSVIVAWLVVYPSTNDPRNLRYQLWKMGLAKIDLDVATGTMVGDKASNNLVLGKTKNDLKRKFGILLTPDEAGPYLRQFYRQSTWNNQDVVFLRSSNWMVVFNEGKATNLVLVKGY